MGDGQHGALVAVQVFLRNDKIFKRAQSMEKRIERMRTTGKPKKDRRLDLKFASRISRARLTRVFSPPEREAKRWARMSGGISRPLQTAQAKPPCSRFSPGSWTTTRGR